MDENKNLDTTPETANTEAVAPEKTKKVKKEKIKKEKPLKNMLLAKKGSYSIALTAIVLVGIIVCNILVSALSDRFVLEFDMTAEKKNSISEENIDFIKNVDKEVNIIVCANEDYYAEYVGSTAQQNNGVTYDAASAEYYNQTVKLIKKYNAYNDKINVQFIDPQSSEFTAITSKYPTDGLAYGDIFVSLEKEDGSLKYKKLGFSDIYDLQEDETYAMYGMSMSTITGNGIETALTGAVSYVTGDIDTKVALFTGHSSNDYTDSYKKLLEENNYSVTAYSDSIISSIENSFDVIVIPAPTKDLLPKEIKVLEDFLDNNGKYGKGIQVYLDASAPYLKNFYKFLEEWGVEVSEGLLFETNDQNYMPDDPTTMGSYNTGKDEALKDLQLCITGKNAPIKAAFESQDSITVTSLMETPESVVAAPKGTSASWKGAGEYEKEVFPTVLEAVKLNYGEDNVELTSRVAVFSSVDFLSSEYNESTSVANKQLTLLGVERASGNDSADIYFVSKSITTESFAESVTEGSSNVVRIIFMFLIPIAVIAVGVVIFIKRRNS